MTKCFARLFLGICLVVFASCLPSRSAYGRKAEPNFRARAANLGGWLVVEGWMSPSLFDGIPNGDFLDGTIFLLKSVTTGKYLCLDESSQSIVLTDDLTTLDIIFRLWRINETNFNIRLQNKDFIGLHSSKKGAHIVAVSKEPGRLETFKIFRNRHNPTRVRIRASNGFFWQVGKDQGHVRADSKGNGTWGNNDPSVFEMLIQMHLDGEFQLTNAYGQRAAQKVLTEHWRTFVTEKDFEFMSKNGINTVRIPVGWWIASGPTPPAPYVGGSLQFLDNAFSWAKKYGLKVMIDLHAGPGAQIVSAVGSSRDGFVEWGTTEETIQTTLDVIDFLASRYAKHPSLYAVELLNEPCAPYVNLTTLTKFYRAGYNVVRKHSSTAYVLLSARMELVPHKGVTPVDPRELFPLAKELDGSVVDVHYYHTFMDIFKIMDLRQNIEFLHTNTSAELSRLTTPDGPPIFIGEWVTEWASASTDPRPEKVLKEEYKEFGKAQLEVYGKATFGWAYWGLKCDLPHFSLEWMINNGYLKL